MPIDMAWRRHYNTVRPHRSFGYRPPAPEALVPRTSPIMPWEGEPIWRARAPNAVMASSDALH